MTAQSILIISHCWKYDRLLAYQLSSLILYPPKCKVHMVVCTAIDDDLTRERFHQYRRERTMPPNIYFSLMRIQKGQVFRRAIGRDIASKACEEDLIWYSDCDQAFGPGCLDAVCKNFVEERGLCYPRHVGKCPPPYGDELIEAVQSDSGLLELDPKKFTPQKYPRAIGGVQIVSGDTARDIGYCRGSRQFQRPAKRWMRTKDDVRARKVWGFGRGHRIEVPNLWRIRHTKYGRTHVGIRN